ncbi:hypothetical protein Q1695_012533 [Nippostrongylus brasiliensis]|nr:hypothetical protein Q1695_012533 [Nippostrongylus brasiliensis]
MSKDTTELVDNGNGTYVNALNYTPLEKSAIIWAVAIGTIIGSLPVNICYIKLGARWPFFVSGILSACATVLIPMAAHLGLPSLLFFRFVQGLAYSADFAAIGILCVRWAPLSQMSIFISTLTCFSSLSVIITDPAAAWLCDSSLGWRSAFYFHAAAGVVLFTLWAILYRDDPQLHPSVSEKELKKIQKDKTQAHIERTGFVPYKEIITNKVILVIWFNAFVELVTLTLLLVYAPIYFHSVLKYDISTTGVLVSLLTLAHLPIKFVGAYISDEVKIVSECTKIRMFNTVSLGCSGITCALMGVFSSDYPRISVTLFGLAITFIALNPGGFYKCATFTSRQYAHFVVGTIQFMKCLALFVAPAMVGFLVSDESSRDQWRWVYWINGALLILANFAFLPIATDKPADFTLITKDSRKTARVADVELAVKPQWLPTKNGSSKD